MVWEEGSCEDKHLIWPSVLVIAPSQELLLKSTNRNLSVAVLGECFGWIETRTWQDRDLFGW